MNSKFSWERVGLLLGISSLVFVLVVVLLPPTALWYLSITEIEDSAGSVVFGLGAYWAAFKDEGVQQALGYSLVVAGIVGVVATFFALIASIIFIERVKLVPLCLLLGLSLFVPGMEHGLALSSLARQLGLGASSVFLILAHISYVLPYCSAVLIVSLWNFRKSLLEVAAELGAERLYIFRCVLLPHAKAGIVASFLVGSLMSLNEHARSFYLSDNLVSLYVYGKMRGGTDPAVYAVGSIFYVVAFLITLAYILFQLARKWEN